MKPWILEKYPKSSAGIFTANSDIHYFVELMDDFQTKYGVKIIKEQKTKNGDCPQVTNTKTPIPEKIKDNNESKMVINKKELKNEIQNKKVKIIEEEDIKQLRIKNREKINSFLLDFIQENELNKKRANSMMSLRHSKTISSFTTCDDSICLDDKKDGKYRINLNLLIIDNSEINVKKNKTKDIIQKSRKLYQEILNKKSETKETKKKFGNFQGIQRNMTIAFHLKMYPKYKEIEDEKENSYIEYKNKKKLLKIYPDLLLKKIIFDDFVNNHLLLIYHFCQQCFCFLDIDIFFKKIFHCYGIYKKKNIPLDKLKNLIEFINILIVEMFVYYEKVNCNKMQISLIKKFYNELMGDLITNYKEEEKNIKVNEIKESDNINSKRTFRFDSFCLDEGKSIYNDSFLDKNNLLNMNLNFEVKNINIFIYNDTKESHGINKNKNEINNKTQKAKSEIKDNKKENITNIKSSEINIEYPKFYKIMRTLKKANNEKYSIKSLNKIDEEIKEENNEDDSYSSSSEGKKENSSDKENSGDEDIFLKVNKSTSEVINNLLAKVFNHNTNMLSKKEEIMNRVHDISSLLDVKEGQIILPNEINEVKSEIPFYTDITIKKKSIFEEEVIRPSSFVLSRKRTLKSSFTLKPRSNTVNFSSKNYFCITDWNIEDIGDKLAQISKSLLNKIHIRELLKGVFLKENKNITSPNVVNCINNFNKLTSFIIQDVISYDTPKLRARAYEAWVQVCDYCKMNRNYNDCLAIYSALNNYIITGLNLTLKEVKSKTKSLFETISRFCTVEDNYRNIRNDMAMCEQDGDSFIPYLGMILRDINFIEESFKYINENGFINMEKIEKIDNLLEKYFKYKKDEKKRINKRIPAQLNFLEKLEVLQEEELENRANNIEPVFKYEKQDIKTLTNIDKIYFQKKDKKRNSISYNNFSGISSIFNK